MRLSSVLRGFGKGTVVLPFLGFAAWTGWFIYLTSFICFDGVRRFCLFDDAMISMRYAWNLSHGNGLVWNPGEYVEGITNLLMTLYMSPWTAFLSKGNAVLAVQISGAVFLGGGAFFCARAAKKVLEDMGYKLGNLPMIALVAACLAYYPLNYWALMGMENSLLVLLIAAGAWRAVKTAKAKNPDLALGVILGLMFLTRPDTALLAAAILVHRFWSVLKKEVGLKKVATEVGVLALFIVAVTGFRWLYYGEPLPNTHRLKLTGTPLEDRLSNGWIFVKPFLEQLRVPFIAGFVGTLLARNRHVSLFFALSVIPVVYQIYVGGDAWQTWRLTSVMVPILFTLNAIGAVVLVNFGGWSDRFIKPWAKRRFSLKCVVEAVFVAGVLFVVHNYANEKFEKNLWFDKDPMYLKYSKLNTENGLALKELIKPTGTLGLTWAGTMTYYSERRGIDFLGKNDRRIASMEPDLSGKLKMFGMNTLPGHNKYDLKYSMGELEPTYVYMFRWGRDNMSKMVRERYRRVRHRGTWLLVLKDSRDVNWELVPPRYRPDWWEGSS